jgi:hypothetical protein
MREKAGAVTRDDTMGLANAEFRTTCVLRWSAANAGIHFWFA